MGYPIAVVKRELARVLREAHEGPVIITRRGQPDAVLMSYSDYQHLRRLQAYRQMVRLSAQLRDQGVTATDLHEASRHELDERPWSSTPA